MLIRITTRLDVWPDPDRSAIACVKCAISHIHIDQPCNPNPDAAIDEGRIMNVTFTRLLSDVTEFNSNPCIADLDVFDIYTLIEAQSLLVQGHGGNAHLGKRSVSILVSAKQILRGIDVLANRRIFRRCKIDTRVVEPAAIQ